jgi:hypothetical protein
MSFTAGAAKTDITPRRDGLWLAGHARKRKSKGVRDPLCCRALYLSDGATEIALSCLDLTGLRKFHVDQIRARLTHCIDPSRVIVCTTHTHDAPDTIGYFGPMIFGRIPYRCGIDPEYMELVQTRTKECIEEARRRAVPVELFAACGEAPAGLTRNIRREGFKEDTVFVLHVKDERDETVAVLSNYPCHPEMLGHDSRVVSAEFLTDLHETVESRWGGVSVFFQQALGGMVTGAVCRDDGSFDPARGEPFIRTLGRSLGAVITEALERSPYRIPDGTPLVYKRREFRAPIMNRKFLLVGRMGVLPGIEEEILTRTLTTETALIDLGAVKMATVPGEALPEVGFQIQAVLNCRFPFVVCLASDELGYILPRRYARSRQYAYERSMSVGPELTDRLLENIRHMVWKGSSEAA